MSSNFTPDLNSNASCEAILRPYNNEQTERARSPSRLSKMFKWSSKYEHINGTWQQNTFEKMDETFRLSNLAQIPEWFNDFMKEF